MHNASRFFPLPPLLLPLFIQNDRSYRNSKVGFKGWIYIYIYIGPSAYLSSYKEFIVWIGSEEGVERDVTETEEMSISVSLRLTDGKFDRF